MKKLNPSGAFYKVKNHLESHHKIPRTHHNKFNLLIKSVTKQQLYDDIRDDIR